MFIKPAENPGPPYWLPYVSIADADAAFAHATGNGAKTLVPPMTVPGGSRIAQLMDPTGAAFAVHSPGSMVEEPAPRPQPKAKVPAKKKSPKKKLPKKKAATRKPVPKKRVMKKAASRRVVKKSAPKKKAAARKKTKATRRKK